MFIGEIANIVAYALIPVIEIRATKMIKIEVKKNEENTDFTWFGSVPTSIRTMTQTFYYHQNKVT